MDGGRMSFLFPKVPRSRIAALRSILYAFIFVDVFLTTSWVQRHADVPQELYHPLWLARVLDLPEPTALIVRGVQVVLLVAAVIGITGKLPRLAGAVVFFSYAAWMFIAFSYGKVDHDRVAFLVALAVLPTVGRATWSGDEEDEAAGWAVRCIQLTVVATYFLSVFAKLRWGGVDWVTSDTLMRAVLRRGTFLGDSLQEAPWILQVTQYLIVLFELSTPLLLVPGRIGRVMLFAAVAFHLVTFSTIQIVFLPHMMCLLAFVPVEKLRGVPELLRVRAAAHGST
jgi:Vitamin K-dependent gamma-carboxylase